MNHPTLLEEIHAPPSMEGSEGLLAIIVRANLSPEGVGSRVKFLTPPDLQQQLGIISHPKGYVVPPHTHNPIKRAIEGTQEVLIIRSGRVQVLLYTSMGECVASRTLYPNDVILLVSGGHSLIMQEAATILEVKTGPYMGKEVDKLPLIPRV